MLLKARFEEDLKAALKEKKEIEVSALRLLKAAIFNKEKEKRYKLSQAKDGLTEEELEEKSQLTDEEIVEVISSEIKKRKEAIFEFEKGERLQSSLHPAKGVVKQHLYYPPRKKHILELVKKETAEIEILQKYLPEQLPEEEIKNLVKETIEEIGAKEIKDMGKVMAKLMPKIKGQAEGALVSKIVKELLISKERL